MFYNVFSNVLMWKQKSIVWQNVIIKFIIYYKFLIAFNNFNNDSIKR